jgi:lysophospholipase L1-like esterase
MAKEMSRIFKRILSFWFTSLSIIKVIAKGTDATQTLKDTQKKPINGFKGDDIFINKVGSDILDEGINDEPVSQVYAVRDVIANLEKNFTVPSTPNPPLKIMPLGDSLTRGTIEPNDTTDSGGYRTELCPKFMADGLEVEFVGSQSNGPDSLGNKAHEGHPGWRIRGIADSVNKWLSTSEPDIILLMIGTNDTKRYSVWRMSYELSALIDKITAHSPRVQLLVASIPPIHPAKQPAKRVKRGVIFNKAIPTIVKSKVAQGKKVHFVDMKNLTVNDLTSSLSPDLDNGLHLNPQGYSKLADLWHDAVFKVISQQPNPNQRLLSTTYHQL